MLVKSISLPINEREIRKLRAGQSVLLNGVLLTARDASHKRITETLARGERLSFNIKGQTIYYMGPTPAKHGRVIGSAGPTTSCRMDSYTGALLDAGLKCIIGKGKRSSDTRRQLIKHKAVYLAAVGGAGALIAQTIKKARPLAYQELGTEAVFEIEVENFPAVVINDIYGGDLYQEGRAKFKIE
jgi:fumarate hydratase subunit beta